MVTLLLCAVIILAAAGLAPSSVIAQQEEETSLGEDLAGDIISDVLDGDDEANGDTDDTEINQDSTDTATVDSNQEDQTMNQDDTVIYGDNTANLDDANVAAPIAAPIDVEEEEDEEESSSTPTPPENGKIAFASTRDDNPEIYVMNADGSEQTRLTNSPAYDDVPDWGPAADTEP